MKKIITHLWEKNLSVVVCPDKNFLYMKTHKVAGSSIFKKVLKPIFKNSIFEGKYNPKEMTNWYENTIDKDLESFYKFTFVRNPWDRLVSNYFYSKLQKELNITFSFDEFINRLIEQRLHQTILIHSNPIHDYFLYNDKQYVDFIGRYENLNKDWQHVANVIGVSRNKLPVFNTTNHKNYKTYYNKTTIKLVGDFFEKEIDYLGYTF
jgi:hypothetical protein